MSSDLMSSVDLAPAYAAVVERLRRSIALGVVLPGEKLPPERTLAESLGVSRVTLREALRVLQGQGLIVTRRGSGGGATIAVRSASIEDAREELRRTRPQIDEVFDYRLAVETMAARLAAERRTKAEISRLQTCQDSLLDSADVGAFRRADSAFHLAVADASRNTMLRRSIEDARAAAFRTLDARPFRPLRTSSANGHAAVIVAVVGSDRDGAADAMAEHLRQARREVLGVLLNGQP